MTELGDDMRALRQLSQDRRAANRRSAPGTLTEAGIAFVTNNDGAHLIVAGEWDFWPGAGRWSHRGKPRESGRGLLSLIWRIKHPIEQP